MPSKHSHEVVIILLRTVSTALNGGWLEQPARKLTYRVLLTQMGILRWSKLLQYNKLLPLVGLCGWCTSPKILNVWCRATKFGSLTKHGMERHIMANSNHHNNGPHVTTGISCAQCMFTLSNIHYNWHLWHNHHQLNAIIIRHHSSVM